MTRSLSILGATGSIGASTLKLVAEHRDAFSIRALTAQQNVDSLIEIAREFRPEVAVIGEETHYAALRDALQGTGIRAAAGKQAVLEAAAMPCDIIMSAIVGAAALPPTLAAIRRGGRVALANKECLVCAGELLLAEAKRFGATLLPVDSEHNALFQLFDPARVEDVESITITASGGPFRGWSRKQMAKVTPAQAVRHPNWSMGAKISVDSATLMNKGLEFIEAYHLFPVGVERIRVVVHPESILHGMVSFRDGSTLAQMSVPDMRVPIAYALGWPDRLPCDTKRLDLAAMGKLTFEAPDEVNFPALRLAREALQTGGTAPAILNAANEVAVEKFLRGEIGFLDISAQVEETLQRTPIIQAATLDAVLEADAAGRMVA